ncbi:bacillithiol biosynthesis deacetylase BshB1 [Acetohalobium arabaticum]|uniref:LmbE family protein n=1 Tax=Acetohalobium arabaticum (strain ATCC 49924 / DSM 5501 / Z-7288) TaxID=574087 RepID=D9QU57_ACEAZ|nr:bacillithiol biosynthesis deacetylase BshB1 [Acetohalobium arabaticum]ADL11850.1 LmbE family protein [Acetohalobium arabaticum DSM 5501]
MTVDLLAFGAHPDDVEIGAGGTLIKHHSDGYKTGIVDLTAGEMGSNGTPQIRRKEALAASEVLGAEFRHCLKLPDAKISRDEEAIKSIVKEIRAAKPKVVLAPYWKDRHPDHVNTSKLVTESCFKAGLKKFEATGPPYRPQAVVYYFLAAVDEPDFIVDIAEEYETKTEALLCHTSQVSYNQEHDFQTVLNDSTFLDKLDARFRYLGSLVDAQYGEGFKYKQTIKVSDLTMLEGGV